jgi:hypothetical protein
VLWLDATDSSTITLSAANMRQWNDKSGLANNMIPFSTFSNATVMSSYWNGLNVLNFSGAGVYQAPASSAVYPIDVYIVMALKDLTTHVDVISLTPSAAVDNFNNLGFSEYITSRWYNGSSSFARTPNTASATNETSTSFLLMNWSIANNNFVIRRNGTQISQTASYTWTMTAGSIFQLGWRISPLIFSPGSFAGAFRGYIGEIVAFNSQLTISQRQQVEGYLASKWALQNSLPSTHPYRNFQPAQTSFLIITPGTIATVTLSGLFASGGTITWTTSTNAVSYKWYVGTTFPTALVSGTVGNVLTTAVSYAFVASTNYFAWVIPVSSTGTDGATTQSAAASYSTGFPAFYSSSSGFIIVGSFNSTGLNLRTLANAAVNTNINTYTGFTSAWNFVHDKDIDGRVWYGAAEGSRVLIKYTVPVGSGAATTVTVGTISNTTSILGACYATSAMGGASGNTNGAFIIGGFNSTRIIVSEFNAAKTAIAFTYNVTYVSEVYGTEVVPAFASGFTLDFGVAYTRGSRQMSSWTINLNTRSWTNRVDNSYVAGSTGPSNGLGMIYYPIGKAMYTGDPNTAVNRISMFDTSNNINRIWRITQSGNALVWTYLTSFTPSGFNGAATGAFVYQLSTNAYNQY